MADVYPNTNSEGYDYYRNDSLSDSINGSVYDNSTTTSNVSSDLFNFIIYTAVMLPICGIGFIANIICYIILKKDRGQKHRTATFLLQALAVSDNFFLIFACYYGIYNGLFIMLGEAGDLILKVITVYWSLYISPFAHMSRLASVWITVLIAINRYIAVCWPFHAHRLASLKKTKIQVAMMTTICIIVSMPKFFQYTIRYYKISESVTLPYVVETNIGQSTTPGMVYSVVVYAIVPGFLPLLLLISFNTLVMWELRKADKRTDAVTQTCSRSDNSITRVMVVIIIVIMVCNIPSSIFVIVIVAVTGHFPNGTDELSGMSNLLLVVNSSTNFIVYYVLRASFRSAFYSYFASIRQRCRRHRTTMANTAGITGIHRPGNDGRIVVSVVDLNSPR